MSKRTFFDMIISSCKGGRIMENINLKQYGLAILQKNREPYCIPYRLEELDQIFINYSKEDILKIINENDSTMKETDVNALEIRVFHHGKWKKDNQVPIITDAFFLTYTVPLLFMKFSKQEGIVRDISNHLEKYLKQENVRSFFKLTIQNQLFLENWDDLNYEEQRIIRTYLASKYDVKKLLNVWEEEQKMVEVLQIPDENSKDNVMPSPMLTRFKHKDNNISKAA